MRRVNDPHSRTAAAAGGCVLLLRTALQAAGGFPAIKSEIIDDVRLARRIKANGAPLRLAVCRRDVASTRVYGSVAAVWRMVRRTAFDELGYSWALLLLVLGLLFVMFPLVLLALAAAVAAAPLGAPWPLVLALALAGLVPWALQTTAYVPTVRLFGLPLRWAFTLPLAGTLYGGMTLDSARVHAAGAQAW
jgi:hypothetical protein